MRSPEFLVMLMRYKAWADDRLFATLSALPEQKLVAERKIVFGSILRTLNHVYAMDVVWKAHLEGKIHGFMTRNPENCPSFSEISSSQSRIDDWYIRYADSLSPEQSKEKVDFKFIGGGPGSMSRCDILLHVVNHTTYHRGHIGDMIYDVDAEPPTTDLPVFLQGTPAKG